MVWLIATLRVKTFESGDFIGHGAGSSLPVLVSGTLLCPKSSLRDRMSWFQSMPWVCPIRDCMSGSYLQESFTDMVMTREVVSTPNLVHTSVISQC